MDNNEQFSPEESLRLISSTINKVKQQYNESGVTSIFWGAIVAFCGVVSYTAYEYKIQWLNNIWFLTLIAVVVQLSVFRKFEKKRTNRTYYDDAIGYVWLAFGISMGLATIYNNVVGGVVDKFFADSGAEILQKQKDGSLKPFNYFAPSFMSILLILYSIPTFITGMVYKFKPMIIGAFVCYACFFATLFVQTKYDMLLCSVAAISMWLIPGLILRSKYLKSKN
jgi:hypothetical protein